MFWRLVKERRVGWECFYGKRSSLIARVEIRGMKWCGGVFVCAILL